MMGTAVKSAEKLWLGSPAVRRADWLAADTQFEELNVLHEEHQALLAEMAEKREALSELVRRYQVEDEGDGKRTPASKRQDALGEARYEADQMTARIKQFIADAITTIQEHEAEWREVLLGQEVEGHRRVEEARRAYLQAKAEAEQAPDLRVWIERTATGEPVRLLHWGWFLHKPSSDRLTIANQGYTKYNPPSAALRHEREIASNGAGSGGVVDDEVPDYGEEVTDYSTDAAMRRLPEEVQAAMRKRAGDRAVSRETSEQSEEYERDREQALADYEAALDPGDEGTGNAGPIS